MTHPRTQPSEADHSKVTTFKFTLTDGTGGTYRTDRAKTEADAMIELQAKYGIKVASVTFAVKS